MHKEKTTTIAIWTLAACTLSMSIAIARPSDGPTQSGTAAVCEEAMVSPVSGHAECVRPFGAPVDPPPPRPSVVKLAVFDFELEDATPAAALIGQTTSTAAVLDKVSSEARRMLTESGRYILIDPAQDRSRACHGQGAAQLRGLRGRHRLAGRRRPGAAWRREENYPDRLLRCHSNYRRSNWQST